MPQTQEALPQNLADAGCDAQCIAAFLQEMEEGRQADGLRRLAAHRKTLPARLHREQKCIDCLDYLIFRLQKSR